ncbi:hypothetical protein NI18_08570 [Sphingomonas sp. Ant20]|nr:hypothetical protein NI18_08570 [Sphingomonas sp. Ant20]
MRRRTDGHASPLPYLWSSPANLALVEQERRVCDDVGEHAFACRVRVTKSIESRSGLGIYPHVDRDIAIAGYAWRPLECPGLGALLRHGRRYRRGSYSGNGRTRRKARPVADLA